ncbi:EAL domain-containing protein [Aromatoleum bremense]|uniref:EAL domain-containing protein n=1 Tax=Aromatoleum bremense TaxID=76115 RepID=A0ABX1NV00_9RHOO|nr:EAL domain-containing protein [Aromatoleum bremense]NMG15332.1 EAL domain-containing protein [Aromatoleum bremense]
MSKAEIAEERRMDGIDERPCAETQWEDTPRDPLLPDVAALIDVLRRHCAVDFSDYKTGTLLRRMRRRMTLAGCDTMSAYHEKIVRDDVERNALCHDLLINVTEFFRDPAAFSLLADEVLPDMLRGRNPADALRLWSAGCASGEEAYTLALLALDAASRFGFTGDVKIFATDIHPGVLSDASQGMFRDDAVRAIPEALLRRYFQRTHDGWRVDGTLRRHVVFARHNLLTDPPFTRIDLALCRNLLIYLQNGSQLKALAQLHFALKPQGLLMLGASETVGEHAARAFMPVDRSSKLYRKQAATLPRVGSVGIPPVSAVTALPDALPANGAGTPEELEAELLATRERLHEMIVELKSSHEHIDLANEELTASNEELQSANEELKSVNEDLYILNRELEDRNAALANLNRDYDHLLASTKIGTVFLDAGLRVRRFSAAVEGVLALRASDAGRPLSEITYRAGDASRFLADLQHVAATGEGVEREVDVTGRWYLERMLPFHGEGGVRDGVVLTYTDISRVKTAQAEVAVLAAERTRLQGILDALPDGAYIVGADHVIEYLNPALERQFGAPAGRKCFEYLHGRSEACTWCNNDVVFAGSSVHAEWTAPSGRSYDLFDMPFRNPDGTLSKFEIFHDITPIKESRRQLAEATSLAQVGYWEWQLPAGVLHWGEQTDRLLGHVPGKVTPSGATFLAHVHPDDRKRVAGDLAGAVRNNRSYVSEFRLIRSDGALRMARANGHLQYDREGRAVRVCGAIQDITELRATEAALRNSEERFAIAMMAAPFAIAITRVEDGRFIEVNDKYEIHFGWKREDLIGKTSVEVNLWPDPESRQRWLETLRQHDSVLDFETVGCDRSGAVRQVSLSSKYIDIDGEKHVLTFVHDITDRKEAQARVEYLAHHDALTGLPNRVLFRDRFALATAWAERAQAKVALLFVDLDHFKTINDTLGHPAGDGLLQGVALRLRECLRETDTVSRLGGDEFLIALTDIRDPQAINSATAKIFDALAQPFELEGHELTNTMSIGIAIWPDDGKDFDTLLKNADTAMYQAKRAGRNTWRFYTEQMNVDAVEQLQIRTALHRALENDEFLLHYQPQINLASGHVVGVEALLRWHCDKRELVAPGRFIPAAEDSGLIVPIGDWVLREACMQAARWTRQGLPELSVAVNLSAVQFRRGDLERSVVRALSLSGLDPARLELELTESLLLVDSESVIETLRRLKSLGVRLSIDDFGTGYSSLAYLKRFAVDKLKIDQSFVRDIATDPDDAAIVRAIVSMARTLKLQVIAEGVESEDIDRFLCIFNCDEAQGYHYARPMPADALAEWLVASGRGARGPR